MVVSEQLRKQIIIEVLALIFLIAVILYAIFAIQKSNQSKVSSVQGMVIVIDDMKMKSLEKHSDGEGLELEGTKYTVTNNNNSPVSYDLILIPNIHDEAVLNNVRISTDDLYVSNLIDLPRKDGGYVLSGYSLDSGYTKVHLIKAWYKLGTDEEILKNDIKFEYRLIKK